MVIPNRNIALVSNYRSGALKTVIDVAVQNPEQATVMASEIQNDRVAVFYRIPEPVPVSRGKNLDWLRSS